MKDSNSGTTLLLAAILVVGSLVVGYLLGSILNQGSDDVTPPAPPATEKVEEKTSAATNSQPNPRPGPSGPVVVALKASDLNIRMPGPEEQEMHVEKVNSIRAKAQKE